LSPGSAALVSLRKLAAPKKLPTLPESGKCQPRRAFPRKLCWPSRVCLKTSMPTSFPVADSERMTPTAGCSDALDWTSPPIPATFDLPHIKLTGRYSVQNDYRTVKPAAQIAELVDSLSTLQQKTARASTLRFSEGLPGRVETTSRQSFLSATNPIAELRLPDPGCVERHGRW
jgi:hypothetical protein